LRRMRRAAGRVERVGGEGGQSGAGRQYRIGTMFFTGQGLPEDRARGLELVQSAATAGLPAAMFELGRVLLGGLPELRADPERGVYLLQGALIKGVPAAVLGEGRTITRTRMKSGREYDGAFGGLGVLPVEKGGVADGADAEAAAFVGNLIA